MNAQNKPEMICLESLAFYRLIDNVADHIEERLEVTQQNRWITGDEVLKLLGISSRTTLQKYRDEGKIRYSQITKKVILYDRKSILDFIETNSSSTF